MSQGTSPVRRRRPLQRTISIVTLILLLFLLVRIPMQNFHIQGHSMEPTLHDQEYVIVNKAAYLLQPPQRGDVIVFQYPLDPQENYIKRIIAIPGDVISVVGETVTVDSVTLHEPYINKDDPYNPFKSFNNHLIGPNQYFVMGDNRGNSSDSREWGLVPRNNIEGKALVVYWPFNTDNLGFLANENSVFAQVHQ